MIRVFFDVDGVLIEGFHARPERRQRWDENIEQDFGIPQSHLQEIFFSWFPEVLRGKADFVEEMGKWLKKAGYTVSAHDLIDYWHRNDAKISPVFSVVKKLYDKNVPIYTATNQTHKRMDYLKKNLGWQEYFTDFYYSARFGCLKHDPAFFAQIENELSFDPEKDTLLYFDDDLKNIEVSSARGWTSVLVDGSEDVIHHPVIKTLMADP